MSNKINLTVGIRERVGKGAARASRRDKKIPGVIYGNKKEPVAIEINAHEWSQLIKQPGLYTKEFDIKTPNGAEVAMLADIQYHPVTDVPTHVDFTRIDINKEVLVDIPLTLINEEIAPGVKAGGVLNFVMREVTISAKIAKVPASIEIDVANMNIGDVIHGSDLKLPSGVSLANNMADEAFVAITGQAEEKEEAAVAADAVPATKAKEEAKK